VRPRAAASARPASRARGAPPPEPHRGRRALKAGGGASARLRRVGGAALGAPGERRAVEERRDRLRAVASGQQPLGIVETRWPSAAVSVGGDEREQAGVEQLPEGGLGGAPVAPQRGVAVGAEEASARDELVRDGEAGRERA